MVTHQSHRCYLSLPVVPSPTLGKFYLAARPGTNKLLRKGPLGHLDKHSPIYQVDRFALGKLDCLAAERTSRYQESFRDPLMAQNTKNLLHGGSGHLALWVVFAFDYRSSPVLFEIFIDALIV